MHHMNMGFVFSDFLPRIAMGAGLVLGLVLMTAVLIPRRSALASRRRSFR
jgi:hypothetical protein